MVISLSFLIFSKETMKFILFLNFSFLFDAFLILDKCNIFRIPRFKNSLTNKLVNKIKITLQ